MTPKEAISTLELAISEVEWNYPLDISVALETAMEALKKQIPRKPIDVCTPVVTWGLCPICKGELNKLGNQPNRVFKGTKYCPDCGQALEWGETDD